MNYIKKRETMPASKKLIRRGYNRISKNYRTDRGTGPDAKKMMPWLGEVDRLLKKGSGILELGCGMGIPAAKFFAVKHDYLGVDISDVQVQRANKLVSGAKFRRADMTRLRFSPATFNAVLAYYSVIHLPLREQRPLLKRIYRWLKPSGIFQATLGWGRWTGWEKNWFGAEMFWSHTDQKTYRRWLQAAGFKIEKERLIREGKGGHVLFLCRKSVE